jgi:hypothetical protein
MILDAMPITRRLNVLETILSDTIAKGIANSSAKRNHFQQKSEDRHDSHWNIKDMLGACRRNQISGNVSPKSGDDMQVPLKIYDFLL